ncbi:MAG: heparinase, partial [Alphaproteobacteria bacterium]|nr:heparinase [Alphaproteobacteria bacterium]
AGPRKVSVRRHESAAGIAIEASHDGYAAQYGLVHGRMLALAGDGLRIDGVDELSISGRQPVNGAAPFQIRFHIHPQTNVSPSAQDGEAILTSASGQVWVFSAAGGKLSIEESIFFASPEGARASWQVVISGSGAPARIEWSLAQRAPGA